MNATELFLKDGKTAGIFFCGKCRMVAHSQQMAEECCQSYKCQYCGKDTGTRHYTACDECRAANEAKKERERFEKAEKLATWGGWVYSEGLGYNEGFFPSIEDLLDYCLDEEVFPEYVWACKPNHFAVLDADSILQQMEESGEAYEDFERENLNGIEELKVAVEKFNEANANNPAAVAYEPDYTKAVIIDKATYQIA